MKYRAIVKQVDGWYIGWLVDIPGVNAQEKTYEELLTSLQIGAVEMLATPIEFDENARMVSIDVPNSQLVCA
ncbi:MAG: type II toxin-antitoxin system HicB family antitoxin [Thermoguttaceae bacterium]